MMQEFKVTATAAPQSIKDLTGVERCTSIVLLNLGATDLSYGGAIRQFTLAQDENVALPARDPGSLYISGATITVAVLIFGD